MAEQTADRCTTSICTQYYGLLNATAPLQRQPTLCGGLTAMLCCCTRDYSTERKKYHNDLAWHLAE